MGRGGPGRDPGTAAAQPDPGAKSSQWASPQQREKPAQAESATTAAPDTHPAPGRAARKLPVQVKCSEPAPSATHTATLHDRLLCL